MHPSPSHSQHLLSYLTTHYCSQFRNTPSLPSPTPPPSHLLLIGSTLSGRLRLFGRLLLLLLLSLLLGRRLGQVRVQVQAGAHLLPVREEALLDPVRVAHEVRVGVFDERAQGTVDLLVQEDQLSDVGEGYDVQLGEDG